MTVNLCCALSPVFGFILVNQITPINQLKPLIMIQNVLFFAKNINNKKRCLKPLFN
jgi:hypothetical protein